MERNKTIMKLCYLQTALYIVFLTSLVVRHRAGISGKIFALLIILSLFGCAVSLTLADYMKNMIQNSGFDVAGVHDKKSLEKRLQQLQNADDTLDVGIMMFDLNNLKKINDTYGHAVGDKVLIAIAETLQKVCRDKDVIFRLGGDEFAIFMPGMMEQKAAEKFFARLFENIRQIDIEEMQGKSIEISMGACFYEGTEEVSFDELYKNADSVMYQSKEKQGCSAMIYGLYTDKKDS